MPFLKTLLFSAGGKVQAQLASAFKRLNNGTHRFLPCSMSSYHNKSNFSSMDAKLVKSADAFENDEKKAFDDVFPLIIDKFTNIFATRNLPDVGNWFSEILKYNVPHGKKNRGITVVGTFKLLVNEASSEQLHAARIVGWCLEIMQASFLITDDLMDQSITRRGQPCWYKKKNVGTMVLNDTIMLNSCIYQLLSTYIQDRECSSSLEKCFSDAIWNTSVGQCLDMLSAKTSPSTDFSKYTYERYSTITKYKTAYYSLCLPVHLGLVLAGMKHAYTTSVESLLLDVGNYFQIQDDYLDCFGDPKVTGKIGTDIEDGKCCWPIVMALPRINSEQRKILEANYGKPDAECTQKVRDIYNQIGLKELYAVHEKETFKTFCDQIEEVSKANNIPQNIFYKILNKFYKRNV